MINNQIILNVQYVCQNLYNLPTQKQLQLWVNYIFSYLGKKIELTIRIVDIKEIHYLNWFYVGKNTPTNVLSFPFILPPKINLSPLLLGDIIICKQIIEYEAKEKKVPVIAHWAHIIIHGSLHLLGYNHIVDIDAVLMQKMELNIIQHLGYKKCCY